jgi:5-methylcytosine-specific restriction endonuclease McrA
MAWTPEQRGGSDTYNAEYRRNAAICKRRANGHCERCGKAARNLAADHITPVSQGGTHDLSNLQALCAGPGSCHARKTAREGNAGKKAAPPAPDPAPRPVTRW